MSVDFAPSCYYDEAAKSVSADTKGGESMKSVDLELLREIPLFQGITPGDLQLLLGCLNPGIRRCQKGEIAV